MNNSIIDNVSTIVNTSLINATGEVVSNVSSSYDILSVFGVIAGIVFLGFLSELIFKKTNIPDVLFLIIVGIVIGSVLNWVSVDNFGYGAKLFTTFALVFILFQGGLNIEFKTLFKSLPKTMMLTITTFILTVTVITGISYLLYQDLMVSLLVGMILGGTSSAVVIPLVNNLDLKDKYGLVLTLESAISDVLCIVGSLTILQVMKTGVLEASSVFNTVLSSFSLALIIGVLAGLMWIFLLHKFLVLTNAYMVTIALVIGLYAFVESPYVSGSGAIAALAFGLMLGNSKSILEIFSKNKGEDETNDSTDEDSKLSKNVLSNSAKNFYSEISFFVKTFFFVYLGILIDFSNMLVFVYGAFLTIGIFLVRPYAVKYVFRKDYYLDNKERTMLEILVPKGLAAAVLAGVAVQSGVLDGFSADFVNVILSTVLLTIIITSILIFLTQKNMFNGFLPYLRPAPTIANGGKKPKRLSHHKK